MDLLKNRVKNEVFDKDFENFAQNFDNSLMPMVPKGMERPRQFWN